MDVPPELRSFDLRQILMDLVQLNILTPFGLSSQVVNVMVDALTTERVTHAIVDEPSGRILAMEHVGLKVSLDRELTAGKLITKAINERAPIVLSNVRENPELAAIWADDYRTNASAVFPLLYRDTVLGALCLSNLTEEQVIGMQAQKIELQLFVQIVSMFTALYILAAAREGKIQSAELADRLLALGY